MESWRAAMSSSASVRQELKIESMMKGWHTRLCPDNQTSPWPTARGGAGPAISRASGGKLIREISGVLDARERLSKTWMVELYSAFAGPAQQALPTVSAAGPAEQTPVSGNTSSTLAAASLSPAISAASERMCSEPVSVRKVCARP